VENVNLTGHFLIAMPAMQDPYFAKSVTYICEHNDSGAMGVVINQPISMKLAELFSQLNLNISELPLANKSAHFGGPVQVERGFVLHHPKGDWDCTIVINDEIALTRSKDILEAAAVGNGPEKMLITLGYAGWSAGQLEDELSKNAWLTVEATDDIIFNTPNEQKFNAAMQLLGLNLANLSEVAGHA
jgi:putative transcriptional regulator